VNVVLTGSKEERADVVANRLILQDFDVCVTLSETCLIEKSALKKSCFEYIVIDEAHGIKNVNSILAQIIRSFMYRRCHGNLLDDLKELFALLNFT